MNVSRIERVAKSHFTNCPPTHDWSHTERVCAMCLRIGRRKNANLEILKISALLHDVARSREIGDHAEEGARLAREILEAEGCEEDFIRAVCHCIATHRFRGSQKPKTLEAKILYDSDKLDAIGAIGVARAFYFAGENGQRLTSQKNHILKKKIHHESYSPVNEFNLKLKKIKDGMLTTEGRKLAGRRHKYMVGFFERLKGEAAGKE